MYSHWLLSFWVHKRFTHGCAICTTDDEEMEICCNLLNGSSLFDRIARWWRYSNSFICLLIFFNEFKELSGFRFRKMIKSRYLIMWIQKFSWIRESHFLVFTLIFFTELSVVWKLIQFKFRNILFRQFYGHWQPVFK